MTGSLFSADIEEAHQAACLAKKSFYLDPQTGFQVFTSHYLSQRECCSSGCRHCPYRAATTKDVKAMGSSTNARILHGDLDDMDSDDVDVLFYSGGKDSFLTLTKLLAEVESGLQRGIIVLTTFDERTRNIAHQDLHMDDDVVAQMKVLDLPILGVPLSGVVDYKTTIQNALQLKVVNNGLNIKRIVFGDLHLDHIRSWRDNYLSNLLKSQPDIQLHYPLWNVPYPQLIHDIHSLSTVGFQYKHRMFKVIFTVSALNDDLQNHPNIHLGDVYGKQFIEKLPSHVDAFGENGEFHTHARLTKL